MLFQVLSLSRYYQYKKKLINSSTAAGKQTRVSDVIKQRFLEPLH